MSNLREIIPDLQKEANELQDTVDGYVSERIKKLQEVEVKHASVMNEGKNAVKALSQKEAGLSHQKARLEDAESDDLEDAIVKAAEIDVLKTQKESLPASINDKKAHLAEQLELAERLKDKLESKKKEMDSDQRKLIKQWKLYGQFMKMSFSCVEETCLCIKFTHIDSDDHNRQFSITFYLTDGNDKYEMKECDPDLGKDYLKEKFEDLNEEGSKEGDNGRAFRRFVVDIRKKFIEYVEIEKRPE